MEKDGKPDAFTGHFKLMAMQKRAALDHIAYLCVTRWHIENVKNMWLTHLSHFKSVCEHPDLDLD